MGSSSLSRVRLKKRMRAVSFLFPRILIEVLNISFFLVSLYMYKVPRCSLCKVYAPPHAVFALCFFAWLGIRRGEGASAPLFSYLLPSSLTNAWFSVSRRFKDGRMDLFQQHRDDLGHATRESVCIINSRWKNVFSSCF